jgi:acyl-CoA synthetase (AMP-forming)/AMP-acid ligase II
VNAVSEAAAREARTARGGLQVNIADRLTAIAARLPDKKAVVWQVGKSGADGPAQYAHLTFRELADEVDRLASGLQRAGIKPGTRTILFVKPSAEFFALVFALFKVGAVTVMIDPGIGKQQMRACLSEVEAETFIGIPLAHVFRVLYRSSFRTIKVCVTVGRRWFWGGLRLSDVRAHAGQELVPVRTQADDAAAILFTSGSTGPAKGVVYTHGIFDAQVRYLESHFGFSPDESDLPTFPLFALFDTALGMTAVIPRMDFTRPGLVDPQSIIRPIRDHGLTHMFGSPALLDRVSRYAQANQIKLPSVRRVITAGAPVSPAVLARVRAMLREGAQTHTPYGATEALPVASIASDEILDQTAEATARGAGTCVGRPMPGMDVRIIRIDDEPIAKWADEFEVERGTIGEIVVRGSVVTRTYHNRPAATALAKIADGETFWHRMGDLGYFDERGRLWFCGRKAHRVTTAQGTLFTVPCEAVFDQHRAVNRCALVGIGAPGTQRPVICVELERDATVSEPELTEELLKLAGEHELTREIKTVLYHPSLPVDVRHNSKIFREKLAVWAAGKLS